MARKDISDFNMVFTMYMHKDLREALRVAAKDRKLSSAKLLSDVLADFLRRQKYIK